MNIEELQAVAEIIQGLTGSAYDGFILWMVYMFTDVIIGYLIGGLIIYFAYQLIHRALSLIPTEVALKDIGRIVGKSYYGSPDSSDIRNIRERVSELVKKEEK